MRLPSAEHLSQLIHSPVDYLNLYLRCEQEGTLADLLALLESLPFSPIREARRARILYRLGRNAEGRELLESHLQEPLCLAWYVVDLVRQGEEEQLRRIITRYPVTWPLNARPTNLEAKARLHIVRGVAFVTLNMKDSAAREFSEAVRLSELLGDHLTRNVAVMEFARRDLFDGKLEKARSTYRRVLQDVPSGTTVADYSMSYLTVTHWLLGLGEQGLDPWARHALRTASLQGWEGEIPEYPSNVGLGAIGQALTLLRGLRIQWNRRLLRPPLDSFQSSLLPELPELMALQETPLGNEVARLVTQLAASLALALTGDLKGAALLKDALQPPVDGIPQLALAHQATRLECSMLLGGFNDASKDIKSLREGMLNLSLPSQKWLHWWMQECTPHTLHLLSLEHPDLQVLPARTLHLTSQGAFFDGQMLSDYPAVAVYQHLLNPTFSLTLPVRERHQQILQDLGNPPLVIDFLLQESKEMLQVKESGKGKPWELTDGLSKMDP